jgi:hypothetical protein
MMIVDICLPLFKRYSFAELIQPSGKFVNGGRNRAISDSTSRSVRHRFES